MARSSSAYERELKELLQGDRATLQRYTRALGPAERAAVGRAGDAPFLVVRAAGSLGFDLVALRSEFAFPVEVKASGAETIHFSAASGRAAEQLEAHRRAVDRVGLVVLYAFRRVGHRSGDPWRLFAAPTGRRTGRMGLLARRLPVVDTTRHGNAVLRWSDGLPLAAFLHEIAELTDDGGGRA
ncbi:MAG TPA: Holliday junction resolvase [Thermoplasmata archaeon]|nr:Holliday junction resolvase [Thermoplasmata archaeon]HUJ78225.1 Holliday junction resolvase [Thermoplasmata archaeon]